MSSRPGRSASTPGIILIVIGAVFLANSLDLVDIGDLLDYAWDLWPLILIGIGVKMVSDSRRRTPPPPAPPAETPSS